MPTVVAEGVPARFAEILRKLGDPGNEAQCYRTASLARVKFAMSLTCPFGRCTRHMFGHFASGLIDTTARGNSSTLVTLASVGFAVSVCAAKTNRSQYSASKSSSLSLLNSSAFGAFAK